MKKEIQRTREVQDAQRNKELAVISQQKEVEIAKQVCSKCLRLYLLHVIQKEGFGNYRNHELPLFSELSTICVV